MQTKYQLYLKRTDIGRRISLLHKEQTLSVGLIMIESGNALITSLKQAQKSFEEKNLFILMHSEQGRITELIKEFPTLSFILFEESVSFATMANAFANECYTTFFFLSRSDLTHHHFEPQRAMELLLQSERPAAITSHLFNKMGENIPVIQVPYINKGLIEPLSFFPTEEEQPTLYPFLGVGLYERALFQRLRGFDELIEIEYWQQLDFGLRSWLYGYPIICSNSLQSTFSQRQFIIEDRTLVEGVRRLHTRALAVKQIRGKNYIRRVGPYKDRSLLAEVKKRLALYKTDFTQLVDQWVTP